MSSNIRVDVPCTELTRMVLFKEYQRALLLPKELQHLQHLPFRSEDLNKITLPQHPLNVDITSFNYRRPAGTNEHRQLRVKVLLNVVHSERYRQQATEWALANALEKKAYEILHSRMLGAYVITQEVMQSVDRVLDFMGVTETDIDRQTIRKSFYRYRLKHGCV
jgi:hypothetical protein